MEEKAINKNCSIKAPFFEIGLKSYLYGDQILELAKAADRASEKYGVDIIFTCPVVDIRRVKENTKHIHVDPYMLRLVRRIKGDDRIILVSDACVFEGPVPEGYEGVTDICFDFEGEIAGSKLTLDVACRNMTKHTGASLVDVFNFASYNPAKCYGMTDRGEISIGKRGTVWCQLQADITGLPVEVPAVTEAGRLGAAMIAAWNEGQYPTLAAAAKDVKMVRKYTPNATEAEEKKYQKFCKLYKAALEIAKAE